MIFRYCRIYLGAPVSSSYAFLKKAAFLLALMGAGSLSAQDESTIDVNGSAEIYAIPDEVLVSASIDSRGKTVLEASEQNDKLVQAVRDFLKKSGIEDRHIRTEYLTLRPEYPQSQPRYGVSALPSDPFSSATGEPGADPLKPIGYSAVRSFSIVIRDVAKFEPIYKGMLQLGVNRIDGVQFRTSELRKFRDQARLEAVKAAKEKATAMANELGVTLAGVKLVEENSSRSLPFMTNSAQVALPAGGESSSTGGEIAISANVRVIFFLSKPAPAELPR
ncbi:SIMPL domain-containing protein [Pirellulaceae bacterium SH449]